MATISVTYSGELRTQATHLASGNTIITDAPVDNQGRGEAFSPSDLVSGALASCMVTIMGIVARRHNLAIEGTQIQVTKIMASEPRRIAEVVVEFTVPNANLNEKERKLLENAAHTCPVALSLHPDIKQTVSFRYLES